MIPSKRSCLALGNRFRTLPRPHRRHSPTETGKANSVPCGPRRSGRGVQSAQSLRWNILFTKADAVVSEPLIAPSHRPGSSASVGTAPSGNLHPFNPPRTAIVRCQQGHTRQGKAPFRMKKQTHNSRHKTLNSQKCDLHKPLLSQGFQRQTLRHPPFAKAILTRFRGPSTKFFTVPGKFPRVT